MPGTDRNGFSLLEVLLATSILLGCAIVLGQLAHIGSRRARIAEDLSTAEVLCETKMAEILAGAIPIDSVQEEPLEDRPDWVVSIETTPTLYAGLTAIRVTISQTVIPPATSRQFSLVRWVRTPQSMATTIPETGPPEPAATALPPSGESVP
jgi:prepilin-type N-terminal cleavage/methylation domain-containing protein